jgi:hypothetical protein
MKPRAETLESKGQRPCWVVAFLASLTLAIGAFATTTIFLGFACLMMALLIGLVLKLSDTIRSQQRPNLLQLLIDLSRDPEVAGHHTTIAESLRQLTRQKDPVFRELALTRLDAISKDCSLLGDGIVEFVSTESWRVVYEQLLRSPGLHLYRSVAHIESAHYWQDGPGQQSTQLNLDLHDAGIISIERTAIIADHLWPESSPFPVEPLHRWLDQQHRYGIWLRLARESALENDTDLLCDFGIYGSRGVGFQTADPAGRTIRFTLDFNFEKVQEAEVKWNRLALYAVSYADLLDQQH